MILPNIFAYIIELVFFGSSITFPHNIEKKRKNKNIG